MPLLHGRALCPLLLGGGGGAGGGYLLYAHIYRARMHAAAPPHTHTHAHIRECLIVMMKARSTDVDRTTPHGACHANAGWVTFGSMVHVGMGQEGIQ